MALHSMLRRASSSVLPLAIRAVGSPRPFRGVLSGSFTAEKGKLAHALSRRSSVPSLHFSTLSFVDGRDLISTIRYEIVTAWMGCCEEHLATPPDYLPFKFKERLGERTLVLTKNYKDEIIKFEVEIPPQLENQEDEEYNKPDEEKIVRVPLAVSITKGSGMCLEFLGTLLRNEICIDSVSIKQPGVSEDRAYEGPYFIDLDRNLQKAFLNYLVIRGINLNTFHFLPHYMLKKAHREYLFWLMNIKNFIEQ